MRDYADLGVSMGYVNPTYTAPLQPSYPNHWNYCPCCGNRLSGTVPFYPYGGGAGGLSTGAVSSVTGHISAASGASLDNAGADDAYRIKYAGEARAFD